jgi:Putative zinc-finger
MSLTDRLTCRELVELVTDYVERAPGLAERERVERHLDACAGCANYLEQFCVTIRLIGTLREDDAAAAGRETLLEQFRSRKHTGVMQLTRILPRGDTRASFGRSRLGREDDGEPVDEFDPANVGADVYQDELDERLEGIQTSERTAEEERARETG